MRIRWRLGGAARAFRRRWPSAAVTGAAVILVALCPLPSEGHSALALIGGAGLGGELLERGFRLTLCAAYRTIHKTVCAADAPRRARRD